jgi:Uma2 family endonuclease
LSTLPKPYLTPSQYLEIERKAEFKSEYVEGEVFAMAGARPNHNLLCVELTVTIGYQLRGKPWAAFGSDQRVRIPSQRLYTYPDLSVACGKAEFSDEDNLLNPVLLAEVLSPSTEGYDRGMKFEYYRTIPSLQYYMLVAQDRVRVDLYTRQTDGKWLMASYSEVGETVELDSLACRVPLAELYSRIEFEPPATVAS